MRGLKRKYFKGQEPDKRYKVPLYNFDSVEGELKRVRSEFAEYRISVYKLYNINDPLGKQQIIVDTAKALDAWAQLFLHPRIKFVLEKHNLDLVQYEGRFPWSRPISDRYIRHQFFLASKECFEMELETLRNMITEIKKRSERRLNAVR